MIPEQDVKVEVIRNSDPRDYQGTFTVIPTNQGESIDVSVKMTIPPEPTPSVNPDRIEFGLTRESRTVEIDNTGTGELDWETEK